MTIKKFDRGLDPLDNSPLVDPVDLRIRHPRLGLITLKVNRRNKEIYLKKGPKAFPEHKATSSDITHGGYYVRKDEASEKESSSFDLVDLFALHELLPSSEHPDNPPSINDEKFEGFGGGKSGGGGAGGDFSTTTDDPQPKETEQQTSPEKEDVTESKTEEAPVEESSPEENSPSEDDGGGGGGED